MIGSYVHLLAALVSFNLGLSMSTQTRMPTLLSSIMKQTERDRISADATPTISAVLESTVNFLDDLDTLRDAAIDTFYTEDNFKHAFNLFQKRYNESEVEPNVTTEDNTGILLSELKLLDNSLKKDSSGIWQTSLKDSYIKRSGLEVGSLSTRLALHRNAKALSRLAKILKFRRQRNRTVKRPWHYKRYSFIDSLASGLIGK